MYFYRGHMYGGIYTSEDELDWDDLYCETCGDSDDYLGYYEDWEDFIQNGLGDDYYYTVEELSKWSGIPEEEIKKLNPSILTEGELCDDECEEDEGEDYE